MAGKITKDELKAPDFLQVETAKLMLLFSRHKSKVYVLLLLILVGLTATAGWYLYMRNYEKSAQKVYNELETLSLKNSKDNDQSAKLIEGFRNVASKYPRSQAALYSYYRLGNLYLNTNQIDLSIRAYDEFITKASDNNFMKIFAFTGKGYCYEIKKDFKNALSSFERASKMPDSSMFQGLIYRDIARSYEEMNDRKNSLDYYRKALEKTTDPTMELILKRKIVDVS